MPGWPASARTKRPGSSTRTPPSAALAEEQRGSLLAAVPMPWMRRGPAPSRFSADAAQGASSRDVDGLDYVDLCLGDTGAMGGHALPAVTAAVAAGAAAGPSAMLPSPDAAWVGTQWLDGSGCRAGSSRSARPTRTASPFASPGPGRPAPDRGVGLVSTAPSARPSSCSTTTAQSCAPRRDRPAGRRRCHGGGPFNEIGRWRRGSPGDVACLLVEPALTNIGIVLPPPLPGAVSRDPAATACCWSSTNAHDLRRAGWLHRRPGLAPDLLVVGKPIGGGIPRAAYGMTARWPRLSGPMLGHEIDVAGIGGTLTGNALALAAIRATLSTALRDEDFAVAYPWPSVHGRGSRR